ncbi:MAG: ABC transporter ATP-binding protein [Anaerolineae bacterium]|nr:ABC transporter ATP-binding protein [Anaerolineae bacterium]
MIQVEGITKWYGDKLALDHVSFSVQPGEVLGLLGLNGAGKTTTMNIMTGYIGATHGTVIIDGHDVVQEPIEAKRVIGYLPEQLAFYGDMRVREFLDFVCDLKRVKAGRKAHLAHICERVGISHMTGRLIRNLSKGYRQRLGFAQALVGDPKVLILDEPTAGLDPSQVIEIRSLIQELGRTRVVIISSHILSEIQTVSTRILILHNGRLLADDTLENLGRRAPSRHQMIARIQGAPKVVQDTLRQVPGLKRVRMLSQQEPDAYDYVIEGADRQDIRVDVFRALAGADLPLLATRGEETSLEQVFLRLIEDSR